MPKEMQRNMSQSRLLCSLILALGLLWQGAQGQLVRNGGGISSVRGKHFIVTTTGDTLDVQTKRILDTLRVLDMGSIPRLPEIRALIADSIAAHPIPIVDLSPYATYAWTTEELMEYAPLLHIHAMSDVGGLSAALAAKSNAGHMHVISDIAVLTETLSGKANVGHTHPQSEIDNLPTDMAARQTASQVAGIVGDSLEVQRNAYMESVTTGVVQFPDAGTPVLDHEGQLSYSASDKAVVFDDGTGNIPLARVGHTHTEYVSKTEIQTVAWTQLDSSVINTTDKYPMVVAAGFVADTVVFEAWNGVACALTPAISYGSDISAAGTTFGAFTSFTSNTTRTAVVVGSITVPNGARIWLSFAAITTKPSKFSVMVKGHRL
jgi:hypothetical protein